jgi:5-methylcytosine-specific restriction endonuclease McrA
VLETALDILIAAELKRQYGIGAKRSTPRHSVAPRKKRHHQPTTPAHNSGHSSEPVKKQQLSSQPTCAGESSENLTANTNLPMTDHGSNSKKKQSRYIPRALRRAVFERDQGQCSFVDAMGHRCPCRSRLQLHHWHPFAKGGKHTLDNLELRCHAHNQHAADLDFGTTLMEKHRKHSGKPNAQLNVTAFD